VLNIILKTPINMRKKVYYNNFKNKDSKMWWKTVQHVSGKTSKPQVRTHTAEELNQSYHAVWNNIKLSFKQQIIIQNNPTSLRR
jgi:hypothetical protein